MVQRTTQAASTATGSNHDSQAATDVDSPPRYAASGPRPRPLPGAPGKLLTTTYRTSPDSATTSVTTTPAARPPIQ